MVVCYFNYISTLDETNRDTSRPIDGQTDGRIITNKIQ